MKHVTSLLLILAVSAVNAEVFKCTDAEGKTSYQNAACPDSSQTNQIAIEKFDPEIIQSAQKKLAEELKQQAEYEHFETMRNNEQRALDALERDAQANENLAEAALIEAENNAQEDSYFDDYYYGDYYYPGYRYPGYGNLPRYINHHKKHGKRHQQKPGHLPAHKGIDPHRHSVSTNRHPASTNRRPAPIRHSTKNH